MGKRGLENMDNYQRVNYLDRLRVLAAIAVIAVHVTAEYIYSLPVGSSQWQAMNILDGSVRWCVPVFVMISGALFLRTNPQGEERTKDYKKIWKRNILHLVTAFLFWSTVYCLSDYYQLEGMDHAWAHRISEIIFGPVPFWYLYMIFGLYVLLPFLRPIAHDKRLLKGFLILSLIFTFLFPSLQMIAQDYSAGRPFLSLAVSVAFSGIGNISWNFTLGYTSYFLLGYALANASISRKRQRILYALGLIGLILVPVVTSYFSNRSGELATQYYGYFFLPTMAAAAALFVFAKYHWDSPSKIWCFLSKNTFGIYLVHHLILFMIRHNFLYFSGVISFGGILILTGIVFVISLLISIVIHQIPVLKNWVV